MPCSVQDMGRVQGKAWGVPMSGTMDQRAVRYANALLGNKPEDAVLECGLLGPEIIFHLPTRIVISGAINDSLINDQPIPQDQVIVIRPGDILKMGRSTLGRYVYLAVDGGIRSPEVLKSRSYCPALDMGSIRTGGFLPYAKPKFNKSKSPSIGYAIASDVFFTVSPGPEFEYLENSIQRKLFSRHFTLSEQCDRMGYRLSGMQIHLDQTLEILSSGVFPGVIQLPPSGYPIVLMRDAPPTGGYPRILVIHENDLDKLSQKTPGDIIKFRLSKGGGK